MSATRLLAAGLLVGVLIFAAWPSTASARPTAGFRPSPGFRMPMAAPRMNFSRPAFMARPSFARPTFVRPNFVRPTFVRPSFARPSFARPGMALHTPTTTFRGIRNPGMAAGRMAAVNRAFRDHRMDRALTEHRLDGNRRLGRGGRGGLARNGGPGMGDLNAYGGGYPFAGGSPYSGYPMAGLSPYGADDGGSDYNPSANFAGAAGSMPFGADNPAFSVFGPDSAYGGLGSPLGGMPAGLRHRLAVNLAHPARRHEASPWIGPRTTPFPWQRHHNASSAQGRGSTNTGRSTASRNSHSRGGGGHGSGRTTTAHNSHSAGGSSGGGHGHR
jgi:hypothetical protein